MWEVSCDRSEEKSDWRGMVFKGTRASFSMPARRARWSGEETRVLKAERSSWEAEWICQGVSSSGGILSESNAYQRSQTASCVLLMAVLLWTTNTVCVPELRKCKLLPRFHLPYSATWGAYVTARATHGLKRDVCK